MKVTKISLESLVSDGKLDPKADKRIQPYLARVDKGYPIDVRTPFWRHKSREEVSNEWMEMLEGSKILDEIRELELTQVNKIGPMSVQAPLAERLPQIADYWKETKFQPETDVVHASVLATLSELGVSSHTLRPLSIENAAKQMENSTNSGLPMFTKRGLARSQDIENARDGKYIEFPAILGWRGQSAGLKLLPKQRTVWMFPQSVNIVEASLFSPLHNAIKRQQPFAAWIGPEEVNRRVTEIIDSGLLIFSTDFGGYDQSLQSGLQAWYFNILRVLFQSNSDEIIDELQFIQSNIDLLIDNQTVLSGVHGVPSGSQLTNQLDSIVHRVAQHYVCIRNNVNLLTISQVQGDDGLLVARGMSDLESLVSAFSELGLDMNPDKQMVSPDQCSYLQRLHTTNWRIEGKTVGIYPFSRALNSLLGSERWRDSERWPPEFWSIRAIMILENCKYHPLFHEVIEFTAKGDKFDLGRKFPQGLSRMLSKKNVDNFVSMPGAHPTYNQERITSSIFDFETVKYLMS